MMVQPFFSFFSVLLVVLAVATNGAHTSEIAERQAGGFPAFMRRAFHGSYILQNGQSTTLYIDGGEERYANSSKQVVNNYTLTIDLSTSFSTSSNNNHIVPGTIDKKGAPTFDRPHMWVNNSTVYSYGGEWSWDNLYDEISDIPLNALWTFQPSADSGTWTNQVNTKDAVWKTLVRTDGGSSTFAEGIGAWHLGGRATKRTDQKTFMDDNFGFSATPGIQFFNYTDKSWANYSSSGFGKDGTSYQGQLQHVPNWGSYGLVVSMGGTSVKAGSELFDMSNITVWDPATQLWYSQVAKGATGHDIPPQRTSFCVVGASSSLTESYEIFVYGGEYNGDATKNGTDYVWILSLPAFQWFRAEASTAERRAFHTCHGVNRQLLSVGGLDSSVSIYWDVRYNTTDPYTEGLKVFDMTSLEWTNYYDATAKPYETPEIIKNFYNANKDSDGNVYPDWNEEGLKNIFTGQKAKITSTTPGASTTSDGSSSARITDSTSSAASPAHLTGGAIAGIVIGSLVGTALIAAAILILVRRKRKEIAPESPIEYGTVDHYGIMDKKSAELSHNRVVSDSRSVDHPPAYLRTELPAEKSPDMSHPYQLPRVELPALQGHELDGFSGQASGVSGGGRVELP